MFHQKSYKLHELSYPIYDDSVDYSNYFREDTVDYWRHLRMYQTFDALLANYSDAKWLTIGDGRFAQDANYIYQKGIKVCASDICDSLLEIAKKLKRVDEAQKENAEALSFDDNAFDFILCKETYHHFARPMLALYEMLRVAKKGVVLIEPSDPCSSCRNPEAFWDIVMRWNKFEEIGNYIYFVSPREMIKVAMGLNLPTIAFKEFNDHYTEGVHKEKASSDSELFQKVKEEIKKWDNLCNETHRPSTHLSVIIFKEAPNLETKEQLLAQDFKVIDLPKNPFV